jgi:2,4-dienoyl-CoA reductase-like NADH-dependent reductase (Old Yellow Enzyme family)
MENEALLNVLKYQHQKTKDSDIPSHTKMTEEIHKKSKEAVKQLVEELKV